MAMKELSTTILIRAAPSKVWDVLTGTKSYPSWNPFIREITGPLVAGEKIIVRIGLQGNGMVFHPTVLACEKNRELCWLGSLFAKGLFDGEHIFGLEPRN